MYGPVANSTLTDEGAALLDALQRAREKATSTYDLEAWAFLPDDWEERVDKYLARAK